MKTSFQRRRIVLIFTICLLTTYLGLLAIVPTATNAQQTPKLASMELSPDGTKVALVGDNSYQAIWDLATNKQLVVFNVPSTRVDTITWSPDGTRVASASSLDGIIRIWNAGNGQLLTELHSDIYTDGYAFVAWSPDGTKLATGIFSENSPIKIWSTKDDNYVLLRTLGNSVFNGVAWSPDSTKLAVAGFFSASIVDDLSKNDFRAVGPAGDVFSVNWSPDSGKLAIGGANTIAVISPSDGKQIFEFPEPKSVIDVVTWSADGNYLETATHASTIKVWDATSWKLLKKIERDQGKVIIGKSVIWSRDGGRLLFLGNVTGDSTAKSVANDSLQITVPIVSSERLATITKRCTKANVQQSLIAKLDTKQLPAFISAVKALTSDQMPPACAADLVAVAEALQAKP